MHEELAALRKMKKPLHVSKAAFSCFGLYCADNAACWPVCPVYRRLVNGFAKRRISMITST